MQKQEARALVRETYQRVSALAANLEAGKTPSPALLRRAGLGDIDPACFEAYAPGTLGHHARREWSDKPSGSERRADNGDDRMVASVRGRAWPGLLAQPVLAPDAVT